MSSIKNIKSRIANVSSTRQIIHAMDMVAATRLSKARLRLDGIRPLYEAMQRRAAELSWSEEAMDHECFAQRPVENTVHVVITSNKGLCGGYNVNVSQYALEHMSDGEHEKLIVIGAKGVEYFRRHHRPIFQQITDVHDMEIYEAAERIAKLITSLYRTGEPDVHTFIDHLVPLYLHTCFFAAASESITCEHAARMLNMNSAGQNAEEVIDQLKSQYNRRRQAAITQELNEIISGADILE